MAMTLEHNGTQLPASFARQIDQATAEMSDKERMLFLQGVALAMRFATVAMADLSTGLKNSVPDLLSGPISVRRILL